MWTQEHTDLLAEGLRDEERVGTGMDRPLELTSASLFERGTVLTGKCHSNVNLDQQLSCKTWTVTGVVTSVASHTVYIL